MADDTTGSPTATDTKAAANDPTKNGRSFWDSLKGIGKAVSSVFTAVAGTAQDAVEHKVQPVLTQDHAKEIAGCRDFDAVIRRDMSDFETLINQAQTDLGVGDGAPPPFELRRALGALVTMRQTLHTNVDLYNVLYLRMLNAELANAQGIAPTKEGEGTNAGTPAEAAPTTAATPPAQGAAPAASKERTPAGAAQRVANLRAEIAQASGKVPHGLPTIHETIVVPNMTASVRRRMKQALQGVCAESREVVSQVNDAVGHVDDDHWVLLKSVIENIETLADELADDVEKICTKYKVVIR